MLPTPPTIRRTPSTAARRSRRPRDVGSSDGGTGTGREYPAPQSRDALKSAVSGPTHGCVRLPRPGKLRGPRALRRLRRAPDALEHGAAPALTPPLHFNLSALGMT